MFHRLLIAFDGSSPARQALAEAVDLAHTTSVRLTVMTVAPEPPDWAVATGDTAPVNVAELNQQSERSYRTMLDAAVGAVPDDIPVTKLLKRGPAGAAIVDEADLRRLRPDRDGLTEEGRASLASTRERQPPRPSSEPRSSARVRETAELAQREPAAAEGSSCLRTSSILAGDVEVRESPARDLRP